MNGMPLCRHVLERDGLGLVWHERGPRRAGDVPLVLQHGLCGSVAQTAEACPDDPGLRLVTLECRGHGASPAGPLDALSIATFAGDVGALVDACAGGPVHLGGISMGAAIVLRLAVRRPALVRSLLLVRPAWVVEPAPDNMQPNLEVGDWLTHLTPTAARAAFEASPTARLLARQAPDNLASLRGFFDREPARETAALLTQIAVDGPGVAAGDLARLAIPVTVIGHEQDIIHPWAHAERLAGLIPQAQLVAITPKAVDKAAYLHDLHAAIRQHLKRARA